MGFDSKSVEELRLYFPIIIGLNGAFSVIVLIIFCVILVILIRNIRKRCHSVVKKLKQAQKLTREQLSPTVDDFLGILAEIKISEEKAKEIYTSYDSRRRKAAEKQLKYELPTIQTFPIFQAFLSESNFIKGAGFRMHRLLHEGRIRAFDNDEEGMTILAPPFDHVKAPIKKALVSDSAVKSPPAKGSK